MQWSPDGKRIAYVKTGGPLGDALMVADADGQNEVEIVKRDGARHVHWIRWDPAGRFLYFNHGFQNANAEPTGISRVSAAGGPVEPIVSTARRAAFPFPYGDGLFYAANPDGVDLSLWWKNLSTGREYRITTGVGEYSSEPGSNGLTLDRQGRLIAAEHGDRRISRFDWTGGKRTVADNWQGKRFNSPNDVVVKSNGDIYFTDPIYGLPEGETDATREIDFSGVYRWSEKTAEVTLLTKDLSRPNGLAFSPDEKSLYVANSDPAKAIWMIYPVEADGTIGSGKVFKDVTSMVGKEHPGVPDGLRVDERGNVFATGPGGVHIYAPDGTLLGRVDTGRATANCAFGGDGSDLYITAGTYILRIRTRTKGAGL